MLPKLVLGSSSPYRKELLERLHQPFLTDSPEVDETVLPGETPENFTISLAKAKAMAVHAKHPDAFVIGSDQVADLNGTILGKPHTKERAFEQLMSMQGQTVRFLTALCIVNPKGKTFEAMVPTTVIMKTLKPETVRAYIDIEEPLNCAGAAKIEKLGVALMKSVTSEDPTA
ncbi:MAG: septum formation protein Maf, partial [Burkholderiaceae bacterium]|nr:septum formation protein Maf [Burkholderiaceae bacterium]